MRLNVFLFLIVSTVSSWAVEGLDGNDLKEIVCTLRPIDHAKVHPKEALASNNWSGYIASPSLQTEVPNSVSYVAGSWIVPTLSATPDHSYSSIWVGIDGFLSGSVEQLGTEHDWSNGAQQNIAWFEMYPKGAFAIDGFPVDTGDMMAARVGYKGDGVFKMDLINYTKGVFTTIPTSYTTSTTAARSCAEWVVEAPFSGGILPLADFNVATFSYCSANINGVTGAINNGNWANTAVTMENTNPTIQLKAVPSALQKNGTSFTTSWRHE